MKTMIEGGANPRLMRDLIRVVLGTALILLAPLVAMQFTTEVAWTLLDFAVAGGLLIGTGLMYVILTRNTVENRKRFAIGFVLGALLALVWFELAVGIFGTPFAGS